MNKRFFVLFSLLFLLIIGIPNRTTVSVYAAASETSSEETTATEQNKVKKGLVKKGKHYYFYKADGSLLKSKWKTIGDYRYYFKDNGRAAVGGYKIGDTVYVFDEEGHLLTGKKSRFVTVNGYVYYVNKKGQASTGWFVVNNRLYRANAKGRRLTTEKDGITFTKKGYAKSNVASKLKILTMQIVDQITTDNMTKEQKLKACWDYVTGSGWTYMTYSCSITSGWQKKCAYYLLSTHRGDCKCFASAFAALACEVGYDAYLIRGRVPGSRDRASDGYTKHTWVQIDGKYYDPEGDWAGWNVGCYGYSSYNVSHTVQMVVRFKS
ncbi:MAG: hypothetical protein LIO94_13710 [Clostridiales bacterium]|nr:hypothetical protein [Clostridiales bacterium]